MTIFSKSLEKTFNPPHALFPWGPNATFKNKFFGFPGNPTTKWVILYFLLFQFIFFTAGNVLAFFTEYPLTVIANLLDEPLSWIFNKGMGWKTLVPSIVIFPLKLVAELLLTLVRCVTSPMAIAREASLLLDDKGLSEVLSYLTTAVFVTAVWLSSLVLLPLVGPIVFYASMALTTAGAATAFFSDRQTKQNPRPPRIKKEPPLTNNNGTCIVYRHPPRAVQKANDAFWEKHFKNRPSNDQLSVNEEKHPSDNADNISFSKRSL